MHSWIITNRVVTRDENPRVDESAQIASPEFRIATFEHSDLDKKSGDDDFRKAVDFVPDRYVETYRNLRPDTDPADLEGTQRLFLSLYQEMRDAPAHMGDTLVFLHGFNYSWVDSLRHLHQLHVFT